MTSALASLVGTLFGNVITDPVLPVLPPVAVPGRKVALNMLRQYISELSFARPDKNGAIIAYSIPITAIYTEQPKNVTDLVFPSIVIRAGEGTIAQLGTFLDESSKDDFGDGTCLQVIGEWVEEISLECWAEEAPQRASMLATIEPALASIEEMFGLRFVLPDYYNETVEFDYRGSSNPDDADSARNRRWADIRIGMRFNLVKLVRYVDIDIMTTVDVSG